MKYKQNQRLTTLDVMVFIGSLLIIVGVSGPIVRDNFQIDKIGEAQTELSLVAKVLIQSKSLKIPGFSKRGVASVNESSENPAKIIVTKRSQFSGDAGLDPWGKPFHYQFARNDHGQATHILVWSAGPNEVNETPFLDESLTAKVEPNIFKGDDLGSITPVK